MMPAAWLWHGQAMKTGLARLGKVFVRKRRGLVVFSHSPAPCRAELLDYGEQSIGGSLVVGRHRIVHGRSF